MAAAKTTRAQARAEEAKAGKKSLNDLTQAALKTSGQAQSEAPLEDEELDVDDIEDLVPQVKQPAVPAGEAHEVFARAAERLVGQLHIIANPKLPVKKGGEAAVNQETGEPLYMNQAEMYKAYKGVVSAFRKAVAAIPNPFEREVCLKHLREIEELARNVRFAPTPETAMAIARNKQNLKQGITQSAANCRAELQRVRATG